MYTIDSLETRFVLSSYGLEAGFGEAGICPAVTGISLLHAHTALGHRLFQRAQDWTCKSFCLVENAAESANAWSGPRGRLCTVVDSTNTTERSDAMAFTRPTEKLSAARNPPAR